LKKEAGMARPAQQLRRREFLGTVSALAAPYFITSQALGAAGQPPASDRIRTALIGSGSRGQQIMAGGDLVLAVCDVDAKHREYAKTKIDAAAGNKDCASYGDFREVLDRDDIDAVVVATPDHWHVPISISAIRAGKAVYVEKPLSLTIQEGRLLADEVQRYGGILQVGSQQRSAEYEKFARAVELVRNGRVGEIQKIEVRIPARSGSDKPWKPRPVPKELDYDMWLGAAPWAPYHPDRCHYNFRFVSDYSGGDVTNWGAHHLDIAQWALGKDESGPVEIEGYGKRNQSGLHDTFFDVHVDFLYANGLTVEMRSGDKTGGVRIVGSDGWVYVSRETLDADPKSILDSRIGPNEWHLVPRGPRTTHMGNWLDCVRTNNPKALNVPVETGHRSATVCHLANLAMELGRPLKWDPEKEHFVDDAQANRHRWRPGRAPWNV
jgi:myo-inositol 2-dehydrogenase/D-chiro-inositol 1-dehydrogenase